MFSVQDQILAYLKIDFIDFKRNNWYLVQVFCLICALILICGTRSFISIFPLFLLFPGICMIQTGHRTKSSDFNRYLQLVGASYFRCISAAFICILLTSLLSVFALNLTIFFLQEQEFFTFYHIITNSCVLIVYFIADLSFSLFISTISPSEAITIGFKSILTLLIYGCYDFLDNNEKMRSSYFWSLLPQIDFFFSYPYLPLNESESQLEHESSYFKTKALAMQLFNCFFYCGLSGCMHLIITSGFNIRKLIFNRQTQVISRESELQELITEDADALDSSNHESGRNNTNIDVDDISSADFHEPLHNPFRSKKGILVKNLTKRFGSSVVLDNITMPIFENQIFCLLGHNGAGKTTLMNIMSGVLRPDDGGVYLEGENVTENFKSIKQKLNFYIPEYGLYESLTVAEHMEFHYRLQGTPRNQITECIATLSRKVGLEDKLNTCINKLSAGGRKKLYFSLATMRDAKVIFFDEPTSGLDPDAKRSVKELIKTLRNDGKTIILATHDMDEADELADRIAILSQGKLLFVGTSDHLKKKYGVGYNLIITPKPDATQAFKERRDELIRQVEQSIIGAKLNSKTSDEMINMTLPFSESSKFGALFQILESDSVINLSLELNTLEDVYVNISVKEEAIQPNCSIGTENLTISSLNEEPSYKFILQVKTVFLRRFYLEFKGFIVIFVLFTLLSVIITEFPDIIKEILYGSSFSWPTVRFVSFLLCIMWCPHVSMYLYGDNDQPQKYLLMMNGLKPLSYLLGNFLADFTMIAFVVAGFLSPAIYNNQPLLMNLWILTLCVFSSLSFLYLINRMPIVIRICLQYSFLFLAFYASREPEAETALAISAIISPINAFFYAERCHFYHDHWICSEEPLPNRNFYTVILVCQGLIYSSLALYLGIRPSRANMTVPKRILSTNPSEEVIQEAQTTKSQESYQMLKVMDLEKTYKSGQTTLKGITFGVDKGQIFGLLGPSGAGKSTALNLITGSLDNAEGKIMLDGKELNNMDPQSYRNCGVCPQFDALSDDLTIKQHFEIIREIKGMSKRRFDRIAMYLTKSLRMNEDMNKKVSQLSYGTRRKLSVIISLIGTPNMLFLDDPSAGFDTMSKRALCNLLRKNVEERNTSIVLATASISEAEALCNKIGILINGEFGTVGTLSYLKNKYGCGYTISVVKQGSNAEEYERVIYDAFPGSEKELNENEVFNSYKILRENFSFGKAFTIMQELKDERHVSDFNLMSTSLEQVFVEFVRKQGNSAEDH